MDFLQILLGLYGAAAATVAIWMLAKQGKEGELSPEEKDYLKREQQQFMELIHYGLERNDENE